MPDAVRHPIVVDHGYTLQAVATAIHYAVLDNNPAAARVMVELLFVLGYQAGQAHEELPEVFTEG